MVAAATVGLLVALPGCGGSPNPLHAVVSGSQRTLTENAQATLTYAGAPGLRATDPVLGKAASIFSRGIEYAAIDVPREGARPGGAVFLVLGPATAYFAAGSAASGLLPAGKTIVSVPLSKQADERYRGFVGELEGLNTELPLDELAWGAVSARSEGHQVIAQLPLERYAVSVDLRKALGAASGPTAGAIRIALRAELAALAAGSSKAATIVPMTVWVDGPGHVVRIETELPGLGLGSARVVFSQFGAAIKPTTPPAPQVVGLSSLRVPAGKAGQSPLLTFGLGQ